MCILFAAIQMHATGSVKKKMWNGFDFLDSKNFDYLETINQYRLIRV